MPLALFVLVILEIGSAFAQASIGHNFFHFKPSDMAEVMGTCHPIDMAACKLSLLPWPGAEILPPISASYIDWGDRCTPPHPAIG
jgi:hypothetical protein